MLRSSIPTRFQKAWAAEAPGAYIRTVPVNSQIGIQDGAASFQTGWVPSNFTPIAGGGVPPYGQDFNGVTNVMTSWDQWYQARGAIPYDATFATAVGGYPASAILDSAILPGAQWMSAVDNNMTDPDDPLTSTNWWRVGIPAGTPVPLLTPAAQWSFAPANGTTIGNSGSNAAKAFPALLFLYVAVWLQFSNTQCPILTSGGAPSTRGANAVADFTALKQLTLPNMKGLGVIGVDTMDGTASTFLSGVPVTIGNTTTPGSILGENLHALITAELAVHAHANSLNDPGHPHNFNNNPNGMFGLATAVAGSSSFSTVAPGTGYSPRAIDTSNGGLTVTSNTTGITITNANAGSGTAHNTVERNMGVYWGLRL